MKNAVAVSKAENASAAVSLRERILAKKRKLAMQDNQGPELKAPRIPESISKTTGESKNETETDTSVDDDTYVRPEVLGGSGIIDTDTNVRLFEPGYHSRYYQAKFRVPAKDIERLRKDVVKSYVEGISWVLLYYYQGCSSWTWYYPYHYAPFASDFSDIANIEIKFELGEPILPYEQLMSVLPAASAHNLPAVFKPLMSNPNSEIIDFYPEDFPIDMNGEKMSWKGLALLPFIDEQRLRTAVRSQYHLLSPEEKARNVRRSDVLLVSNKNVNYERFTSKLYTDIPPDAQIAPLYFSHFKSGLCGFVLPDAEGFKVNNKMVCPLNTGNLPDISTNLFLKLAYTMPEVPPNSSKALILNGFIPSEPQLSSADREAIIYKYPQRWNPYLMKNNLIPVGPAATTQYLPRVGGYRAFIYHQQMMQADRSYGGYTHQNQHPPAFIQSRPPQFRR